MVLRATFATALLVFSAGAIHAQDSATVLGKSAFGAYCSLCHGKDAKGGGEVSELFRVPPSDLTKLSERAGGRFPFADTYSVIVDGMEQRGHGEAEMPIWGDYFIADSLEDRGVSKADAIHITQGRILSLVYYLETIQE